MAPAPDRLTEVMDALSGSETPPVTDALIDAITMAVVATACYELVDGFGLVLGALVRRIDIETTPVIDVIGRLQNDLDPAGHLTWALGALDVAVAAKWLAGAAQALATAGSGLATAAVVSSLAALDDSPRGVPDRMPFADALAVVAQRVACLNMAVQHAITTKSHPEESLFALRDAQMSAIETQAAILELVNAGECVDDV